METNRYVCGCDIGSTYGKAVVLGLDGSIVGTSIVMSMLDPEETSEKIVAAATEALPGIKSPKDF
ncbi:MAG: hypothetical protein RR053_07830, partial [Evtepia sp.]